MEAKELRIGNLIQDNNKEWIVSARLIYSVVEGNGYLAGFKPIPLTEEWLVKFGLVFEHGLWTWRYCNKEKVWASYTECSFENGCLSFLSDYPNIKYVHSLQNLYFALTNEELTIKL